MSYVRYVAAAAGISYGIGLLIEHAYPPTEGTQYKKGDKYLDPDGKEKVFIGYTGHSFKTINNINYDRDLYYGSKAVAQWYAKFNSDPAIGHVIGDKLPGFAQHGTPATSTPRFEGTFAPLSADGMKKINVKVVDPERVTASTEVGIFAAIKRMIN